MILSPYARSVKLLSNEVWEDVAKYLVDNDYKVYTNVKDSSEKPIKNTESIMLSLKEVYFISNYCGNAISLRSGLTDLIAFTDCKLMVIYPNKSDYNNFKMKTGNLYEVIFKNKRSLIEDVKNFID